MAKILKTTDYSMFNIRKGFNRLVNIGTKTRRDLKRSMEEHGFIPAYPIFCMKREGKLWIVDGQHRHALAQILKIPLYYIICNAEVNVAEISNTQVTWKVVDYARAFSNAGYPDYTELLEFSKEHSIALSTCVGILGNSWEGNGSTKMVAFREGNFKVTSRELADRIARLYRTLRGYNRVVCGRSFTAALFAFCLTGLSEERLLKKAKKYPDRLYKFGDRNGYLGMFHDLYNIGLSQKVDVKIKAENALATWRKRSEKSSK